ncbi:MAG: ImmA/IrrE family metallo-endopeptidase [Haliangiales bacterium]
MATPRLDIEPQMLKWACERSGRDEAVILKSVPQMLKWMDGTARPTMKQLQKFAAVTYTPVGYLFLAVPPTETVPLPDLRTVKNDRLTRPSANLIATIHICQQRQEWYRQHQLLSGHDPLSFVGSLNATVPTPEAAQKIRKALNFTAEDRTQLQTWEEATRHLIAAIEATGVLVMVSGIVGNNNHRSLDPEEFRGFAMADDIAPLIFINGADAKSAQMFTMAHEIAHIWLGESAVSDVSVSEKTTHKVESWCNEVAAEFLVPRKELRAEYADDEKPSAQVHRLTKHFKVSSLVILRRLRDLKLLKEDQFWPLYRKELQRIKTKTNAGGNFYTTKQVRIGRNFARAVIESTLEGKTLYRDAFRLLELEKMDTFNKLCEALSE